MFQTDSLLDSDSIRGKLRQMNLMTLDTKMPLRGSAARNAVSKERQFIEQRVGVPIHKFSDYTSFLTAGSKNVWATFRACHLTANMLLSTHFKVTRLGEDQEIVGSPVNRLIDSPNAFDSWEELLYMWVFHMKLTGNAYWLKDELDGADRPRAIYPLLPHLVTVIPHRTQKISKYLYRVHGEELEFAPEEIIHFKRPHPMNLHFGIGDIEPSQSLFNNFINRNSYEEAFLKHGATPSGILTYRGAEEQRATLDDMQEDEWGKLKSWWQSEYGGKANAGKTAFLTGEWQYQRLGLSQEEMQTIESERWTVEQIFTNHGVPLSIAGIKDAANYATARQDEINFRRFEIVPLLDLLVGKLNSDGQFVKVFDERQQIEYALSGLIDVEQVWKDHAGLVQNGGMTMNEIRQLMGLQKMDDPLLNQFFIDQSRVPIELAGVTPPTDASLRMLQMGMPVAPDFRSHGHSCIADSNDTHESLSEDQKYYHDEEDEDEDKDLPDGYRPATNDDVPEGRACGNCVYFNEDDVAADGRARCEYWGEYVEGGYYCDVWKSAEDQKDHRDEVDRRKPPKGAIASYRDGVKRHENGETGNGIEPITIRMAKDFISGAMPTDQWTAKANRWWGRNERFLDEEKGSAAYAAAQLWGGKAGLVYWKAEAERRELVE
jgi:HK97 family phage portal protein